MNRSNLHIDDFAVQQTALGTRMPALDGLRAIAIMTVLWHNATAGRYHGNPFAELVDLLANAGWLGVQLFFVLSGFLITGLLLDSATAPHRFRNFYARRVLRIFPPYYLLVAVVCVLLPPLFPQLPLLHDNLSHSIWYWLFLNNWATPFIGGIPMLPHLWSLAVEEQFYILWPACIFLLPRRALPWLCAGAVVIALITRFGLMLYDPKLAEGAAYVFTIARWDALAIGAMLAFWMCHEAAYRKLRRYLSPVFWMSALYLVGFAALERNFAPTGPGLTPLNQTIAALFFGAIIMHSVRTDAAAPRRWQRWLLHPALQSIGKYSYAMYLFHMPLLMALAPWWHRHTAALAASHPSLGTSGFALMLLICTYSLAALSWRLIERPCLGLKRFFVNPASGANAGRVTKAAAAR